MVAARRGIGSSAIACNSRVVRVWLKACMHFFLVADFRLKSVLVADFRLKSTCSW